MVTRRLNHIFRPDGRAFIVAFDHGMLDGPAKGMEQPAETLRKIAAGGADAILTSYGTALRFAKEIEPLGLILRMDGGGTKLGENGTRFSVLYNRRCYPNWRRCCCGFRVSWCTGRRSCPCGCWRKSLVMHMPGVFL